MSPRLIAVVGEGAAGLAGGTAIAAVVIATIAARWGVRVFGILDVARVGRGYSLNDLTIAIVTGNVDGGVKQLVLNLGAWRENCLRGQRYYILEGWW